MAAEPVAVSPAEIRNTEEAGLQRQINVFSLGMLNV